MVEKKKLAKAMIMLLQLRKFGGDFDYSEIIIDDLHLLFFGKTEKNLEQKLADLKDWLKPMTEQKLESIWLRDGLWFRKFWVPRENFKDTNCIEMVMCNVFFLRFSEYAKKNVIDDEYRKRLGDLLSHVLKRKVWSWKSRKMVWADYDSDNVLKDSKLMLKIPFGLQMWLIRYFEDTNERFVQMYKDVFAQEEDQERRIFSGSEGWISILFDVAEKGVHGDFKSVSKTEVHTVWLYLRTLKIKAKEQENANRG